MATLQIEPELPEITPAQSLAGKNATPLLVKNVEEEWGFNDPLPQQYLTMMKKVFTGELIQYEPRIPVSDQVIEGIPATFSLTIGAAVISTGVDSAIGAAAISTGVDSTISATACGAAT